MASTETAEPIISHGQGGVAAAGAPPAQAGVPQSEALSAYAQGNRASRTIYAVGGLKGGVGKTTFAMFLAMYFALKLKRVLVIDADPISSSAFDWYETAKENGTPLPFDLEPVPSDKLDKILKARWLDYDVIVVDCGGESAGIWTSTVKMCDHFVVVVAPKKAEVKKVQGTYEAAVDAVRDVDRLGEVTPHIVLTRVKASRDQGENPHNEIMRNKILDKNLPLLGHEVPDLVEYEDACDELPTRLGHYQAVFDEMHEAA
ncbi:AAA family ATPase [Streptomyces sp. NPDC049879]|uniref:AAA family ATPase n=1 Tax=Streptomyces sp. NPDC049879 TaxID=3365598 RepID=UPI003795B524